jgi:hypothetical protein
MRATMARLFVRSLLLGPLAIAAACGGKSLDMPEILAIHDYPAKVPFTLTLVMKSCSDLCAHYDPASCSVSVSSETKTIKSADGTDMQVVERFLNIDVHVSYSADTGADCLGQCGPEILAHCNVGPLDAGAYTVVSGSFRSDITVR